ncbi:DUF1194 domain-containing protein [Mesorhizobium sp.]|uniref:DUF1194 domain-containing protein n=1 Tax=Mesorhizobium sp. TaxID=1871066 RepID=UPI0025808FC1|nr:DUF1194 domain-containing protein [Mesorhizobium sp.]
MPLARPSPRPATDGLPVRRFASGQRGRAGHRRQCRHSNRRLGLDRPYEEWLQQAGLVRALVHPDFLRAATAGPRRRIGFAVFTWSSDGKFDLLVPWTVIDSAEDAARVSQALASVTLIDRTHYGGGDMKQDGNADPAAMHDRLTDMSEAIALASLLLTSSPHATERAVMNICANGTDNFEGGTESSRDAALAQGTSRMRKTPVNS